MRINLLPKTLNEHYYFRSLSSLPCFSNIRCITEMTGGLSNPCFKVDAEGISYFAKKTAEPFFDVEIYLTTISANKGIAPALIYHDSQWIISRYIEGKNLAIKDIPLKEKIFLSIKLMRKFHQLEISSFQHDDVAYNPKLIKNLNISQTIDDLLNSNLQPQLVNLLNNYGVEIQKLITKEQNKLINNLNATSVLNNTVCCHSDINFSNVLIDNEQEAWLIDFEYACFAPIEFDLAMLSAVNNIPNSLADFIVNIYQQEANVQLNTSLLSYYLLFCHLINGLWYYNMSHEKQDVPNHNADSMQILAKEQWRAFDKLGSTLLHSKSAIRLQEFIDF